MQITLQMLKDKNACKSGIAYFSKYYPNGADIIDIIKNPKVPDEILHWGYLHLNSTDEEKQLYYDRMNIVDSKYIAESNNISSSQYTNKCSNVTDSQFIFNSHDIESSVQVYDSSMVDNSKFINNSIGISDSELILVSNNIDKSKNIRAGRFLSNIYCARFCDNCNNGAFLEYCSSLSNSYFNLFCENSNNLIFCFGIQNNLDEYYIFNTKVSQASFEIAKKQITKLIKRISWKLLDSNWDETALSFSYNYTKLHKDLLNKSDIELIKKTVKTFIGYDDKLFNLIVG